MKTSYENYNQCIVEAGFESLSLAAGLAIATHSDLVPNTHDNNTESASSMENCKRKLGEHTFVLMAQQLK
jgi:hypothetical protein